MVIAYKLTFAGEKLDTLRLNYYGLKTIPQVVSLWETLLSLPSHKKRYIF